MSTALKVAQAMDWLLELEPVWEVPVTAAMLYKAVPEMTKYTAVTALKTLAEAGVLYVCDGRDVIYYQPTRLRPVCAVQEYLCGRLKGDASAE